MKQSMRFVIVNLFLMVLFCSKVDAQVSQTPVTLQVQERKIQVNGKEAVVYGIVQPDGTFGLTAEKGGQFDVLLQNQLQIPTSVHWHGLILPNPQDGVAFVTQYPIYPGLEYHYQFPIQQSGTYWMHSHYSLQEQRLLSAPLILQDPQEAKIADQDIIVLLSDFSFKPSKEIFDQLRCNPMKKSSKMPDLVEVDYDAFLANARTLEDPEIVQVKSGQTIRLRMINGASATNFFLFTGKLKAQAIAVDGNRIKPLQASSFELASAQRIDLLVSIPKNGGAFPILAQGEGSAMQTGIILKTEDAELPALNSKASTNAGAFTNAQEALFRPLVSLPSRAVDQKVMMELGGNMADYTWTINGKSWPNVTPVIVKKGDRVEITFKNVSSMAHPMHLHGHVFQVTALNGKPIKGAMRDTILVLPNSTATIQFDADHPGVWPLHCHVLYHLEAGMMTVVRYQDYVQPL